MWTLKVKRARNTGNSDDVSFVPTETQIWYSIAVMDNAEIAHPTLGGMAGYSYPLYLVE